MADYLADVGRRLREARLRNRPDLDSHPKAVRELERAHGVIVSEKQYGRWERGESEPRGSKRDAIAAMVGVRKEEIWGEPPLAPEEELRAHLERIEATQKRIVRMLKALGAGEVGRTLPKDRPAPKPKRATQQPRRRAS